MTLAPLAEAWPEPVRKEIVQLGLVDAKVALPMELIDRALRQGRVSFTWRMVRAWLRPSPPPSVSPNDGTILELPLKIVAPLFLAKQREASKPQAKLTVDEDIPNLFFGFPQPDSAPGGAAATARSSDTNYYVRDELDGARVAEPGDHAAQTGPSAGTRFVTKYATPNEIVSRAAALDGVAGALIALPDGLLVASRIPGDFNPDTLAAFLPQIFSKVSQCTKELRMGDLNNLNFTVGNVPWKIFRVNAIYFAAFGRAAEAMPTSQLAALAAELDHKPR
jgi:predicted regulator of Ras-like GTPase activity (Roadblock/LC7/MglB family)